MAIVGFVPRRHRAADLGVRHVGGVVGVAGPHHSLRLGYAAGLLAAQQRGRLESAGGAHRRRCGAGGELVGQGHHGEPGADLPELVRLMSRYDRTVRGGLLAALLFYGVSLTAQASAAPADALMPIEKYTTPKSRGLANAHRLRLIEFSEQIYNCMPWLAVYPGRLGFPKYKDSADDDRYLSMWIWVDQRDDPVFAALPQERRVSAMFSRYGVDMLRRMAALSGVVDASDVTGLSVVLSGLKPGTTRPGQKAVTEPFALFIAKATAAY